MGRGESFRRPSQADLLNGQINWNSEGEKEQGRKEGREGSKLNYQPPRLATKSRLTQIKMHQKQHGEGLAAGLVSMCLDGLFSGKTPKLITECVVMAVVAGFDTRLRESRLQRRVMDKIRAAASPNYLIWMLVGGLRKPCEMHHPKS